VDRSVVLRGVEAVVRAFYAALGEGRPDEAARLFHDDGVLLLPSRPPAVGRATILTFLESHGRWLGDRYEPILMTDGSRAMALVEGGDRNGEPAGPPTVGIFTIEGGAIRQARVVFDTAQIAGEEAA